MIIQKIHLQGFKSAANIVLEDAQTFSVFAGANGSGKSNIVDGLSFFGAVIKRGAQQAIRDYGGYAHIHCYRHRKANAREPSCIETRQSLSGCTFRLCKGRRLLGGSVFF